MQNQPTSTKQTGSNSFYQAISRFFRADPQPHRLLKRQPKWQRQLFIKRASENSFQIFIQLLPVSKEGQITNITGTVHRLGPDHYLLHHHNVTYFFSLKQVQYIANVS